MSASETILLIDGNNLFHRAYHALPPLTDKSGQNANAVFGFSNMILKAISEVKPAYIACAFDTKAPTFRHVEFEAYKAQRVAPPPDLYPQLPKVKEVLEAFGISYFEKAGYEADDLLASIATKCLSKSHPGAATTTIGSKRRDSIASLQNDKKGGVSIIILSGDRDLLQMVDGNIKVQMPGWNLPAGRQDLQSVSLFGSAEVKEKYGLEPHQMVDYKSLTGDPSDNVPGVSGIGPKTASALLQKYHTLENLYSHLAEIPETARLKLEKDKDVALAAKKLVQLDTEVDLATCLPAGRFKINDLRFKPDWDKVRSTFEDLGFRSIINKLPGAGSDVSNVENVSINRKAKLSNDKKKNSDQLELI